MTPADRPGKLSFPFLLFTMLGLLSIAAKLLTSLLVSVILLVMWATVSRQLNLQTCVMCKTRKSKRDGYTLQACDHWHCNECLLSHIVSKLSDQVAGDKLECPRAACNTPLTPQDVQKCARTFGDTSIWDHYEEKSTQAHLAQSLLSHEEPLLCCPNPRCGYIFQYHPVLTDPDHMFTCPQCEQDTLSDFDLDRLSEREEREDLGTTMDCTICLEAKSDRSSYTLVQCGHRFCIRCLNSHVKVKVAEKAVGERLHCPDNECRIPLASMDIRACTLCMGDKALWRLYEETATESFLDAAVASSDDQPLRRCPAEHCNYVFHYENTNPSGREGVLFACPACERAFCLNCPVVGGNVGPAHDGTCQEKLDDIRKSEEEQRRLEQWKQLNSQADARFSDLLKDERKSGVTKPCPKCNMPITKNMGCDHMRCTQCGHRYNWSQT